MIFMEQNQNRTRKRNLSEYNVMNYSDVTSKRHCFLERNDPNGIKYMIEKSNAIPLGMNHHQSTLKSNESSIEMYRHPSNIQLFNSHVNQPIFYLSKSRIEEPAHNAGADEIQRLLTKRRNREGLKLKNPSQLLSRNKIDYEIYHTEKDPKRDQISDILDQYIISK